MKELRYEDKSSGLGYEFGKIETTTATTASATTTIWQNAEALP